MHKRQDFRPTHSGEDPARQESEIEYPAYSHTGDAEDIFRVRQTGPCENIRRSGRDILDADVRAVPRRTHGHTGGGRTRHRYDEQEFRRQDGPSE